MKKLNKKITIVTNVMLAVLFSVVCAVCFFTGGAAPIYGGNSLSAIYNGNRQNKNVSLMFNVYENAEVVEDIIKTLDDFGAKATFFVGGCWADDNVNTLKEIVAHGHEIANHGYFHKDHKKLSLEQNRQEIALTDTLVQALCGVKPTLFAPPSGSFSQYTLEAAYELGHKVIMWSKDTIDWRDSDLSKIYNRATSNPENGDLILMHPKPHTLKVLPRIIEFYRDLGFNLVSVTENVT